jgi:hypothetical protein
MPSGMVRSRLLDTGAMRRRYLFSEVGGGRGGEEEAELGAGVVEGFYADCKQRERCERD